MFLLLEIKQCDYVYKYIYIHTYMYTYIHVYIHTYIYMPCDKSPLVFLRALRCISVTALVASSGELKQTKPKPWALNNRKAPSSHPKIINIYIYIHVYVYIYTCICIYIYTCICIYTYCIIMNYNAIKYPLKTIYVYIYISHVMSHYIPWKSPFNNPS